MLFVSKKKNLRIILKPTDVLLDDKKNPIVIKGRTVEFFGGRYATDDEEEIKMLLNHNLFKNHQIATVDDHEAWLQAHTPEMSVVSGARSSINLGSVTTPLPETIRASAPEPPKKTLEELVAEQVAAALATALPAALAQVKQNKPKKVFPCKVCGEIFPTGVALGAHKKAEHVKAIEA